MERTATAKVIDLTPHLAQMRRDRRRDQMHMIFALWTQRMCVGVLVLYGLLRLTIFDDAPLGRYSGPLAVLWPVAFFLLLISYVSDLLLWQED